MAFQDGLNQKGLQLNILMTCLITAILSSTLAEVKRRGSLSSELKINANQITNLVENLLNRKNGNFQIIAKAIDNTQSADQVSISLEIKSLDKYLKNETK